MIAKAGNVPVLVAPMIDPSRNRIHRVLPAGLTIAEIIDLMLPDRPVAREYIRVALVTPLGTQIVPATAWHLARPNPGVHVVIRVVPGKDALKSILQIVVAIAAIAIATYFAPLLAGTFGIGQAGWQGIIGLGVTALGNLLINALIPPPKPDDKQSNRYAITGWRNRIDPDGAIPFVAGDVRCAPPFAAMPYSEIVGDFLYQRALFNVGYGNVATDDYCIGETSIAEYDEIDIEVREGIAGEAPVSLFPYQIVEESVGAELLYPLPRDDLGEVTDGDPILTPITRTTGADAKGGSVILSWPGGLFKTDDEGELEHHSVTVKIEQRLVQAEEWAEVVTLKVKAKKREGFYRQHTWNFPSRGRWQVRCTMLTEETESMQKSQKTAWAAFQTIRPEYPINMKGLALVALRVKSTHQLSGQLDNVNFRARRICLDWDYQAKAWVERATSNPASIFRLVLQHPGNPRPIGDDGIDLEQLEDWHDFCRINGLKYDRVLEDVDGKIGDVLSEVAAAGRAAKRHDGVKWGVVIDRPREILTVDEYSPRNSYGFKASRSYARYPDGFAVKFLDATNDMKPTQRIVPWPGHTGEIKLTEALEMPGKTDPDEIFREATRRAYEVIHRPDTYRLSLDGPITTATRGDLVNVSHCVIESTQVASRVRTATGSLIELDDTVLMEAGQEYGVQFRMFDNDADVIGTSIVRAVQTMPGETAVLLLSDDGKLPEVGSLAHFGPLGRENLQLLISGIEAGEDFSSHLRLIDAAPIIDDLIEELEIPAWSGRIGEEIDENLLQPGAPRFTSITSGVKGTSTANLISYLIEPGPGAIVVSKFRVEHRLQGNTVWSLLPIAAANGGGEITGYSTGNNVQVRAVAISPSGVEGPYCTIVTFKVGADDAPIPVALETTMINIGALLGGASVQFSTTDDSAAAQVQVYRSTVSALNRATDAVGDAVAVRPSRSYSVPIGDVTRQNMLTNGALDTDAFWTKGTGWTIAAGKASHASGNSSLFSQAVTLKVGKYYRMAFLVSDLTASQFQTRLSGGTNRNGVVVTTNGDKSDRIQAVTGNNLFSIVAAAPTIGSVDNLVLFEETTTCLAAGIHYFWLEPQNAEGVPGPLAGPFPVTIR